MIKTKTILASIAVGGLLFANPVLAASTRSADLLPTSGIELVATDASRVSAPVEDGNAIGGRSTPVLLILFLLIAGGIYAAASGGGGNDSPG
jgi:hypothetical protein